MVNLPDPEKAKIVLITRSFSRKRQLDQYEPIEAFASFQAEVEEGLSEQDLTDISQRLHRFAEAEVERDIENYIKNSKPPF